MGKNIVFLPECHSTNSEAARMARDQLADGSIVITANQTAGKGQRGNTWFTEAGKNLTFSIFLQPTFLSIGEQFYLNRAVALGILEYVRETVKEKAKIKWPNDILVKGRKVCGILIENSISGSIFAQSVVGIGLNVNQREFIYPNASSIRNFTNREMSLEREFEHLIGSIEARYLMLKSGNLQGLRDEYLRHLYWKDENRLFKDQESTFPGVIVGDDDNGRLLVVSQDRVRSYGVKEIEYIE